MGTSRENKQGEGSHSYTIGKYQVTQMGDDRWHLFLEGGDTGRDYATLKEARQEIKKEPGLTAKDIVVGKTYRAKRFTETHHILATLNNDRIVRWISPTKDKIQYDSDTVQMGRKLPIIPMVTFLKWVSHEITTKPGG